MSNPLSKRPTGQVSGYNNSSSSYTPLSQTSFAAPYGLQLRQTINSGTTSVTIPAGITWVYVILAGGGGGSSSGNAGGAGAGGIAWGWTLANPTCIVGAAGSGNASDGGYTRYGNIIAGGGAGCAGNNGSRNAAGLGGSGSGSTNNAGSGNGGSGVTNYWGIPAGLGTAVLPRIGGTGSGSGGGGSNLSGVGAAGGNGISGGGGGVGTTGGGAGGNGLVGGGGGFRSASGNYGDGGNGINILTGAATTGVAGTATRAGGGGGIAGNASGSTGGLGGGGAGTPASGSSSGGAGILYIFY